MPAMALPLPAPTPAKCKYIPGLIEFGQRYIKTKTSCSIADTQCEVRILQVSVTVIVFLQE